ncbi:MAG: succinylglutamate desuccinylase/aspartoacylase family protein [Patescibacteria group bacterium]
MANITQIIPDIWVVESGVPGPRVVVLGGVHGDELPGVQVVRKLLACDLSSLVTRGTLTIGIGNPAAVMANARFVPGDFDLNRSFGVVPLECKDSIAVQRAEALKPFLAAVDVLIDIHATIKPSLPMIISPSTADHQLLRELVSVFGIKKVITGPALAADAAGMTTDAFVFQHGGLGITLETGWMMDTSVVSRVEKAVLAALGVIGIAPTAHSMHHEVEIEHYDAYWSVPASGAFVFTREWDDFALITKGECFATDSGVPLVVPQDSYLLFQKPQLLLKAGTEACLMLRRI